MESPFTDEKFENESKDQGWQLRKLLESPGRDQDQILALSLIGCATFSKLHKPLPPFSLIVHICIQWLWWRKYWTQYLAHRKYQSMLTIGIMITIINRRALPLGIAKVVVMPVLGKMFSVYHNNKQPPPPNLSGLPQKCFLTLATCSSHTSWGSPPPQHLRSTAQVGEATSLGPLPRVVAKGEGSRVRHTLGF